MKFTDFFNIRCVYKFTEGDKVLYVGSTDCYHFRLMKHKETMERKNRNKEWYEYLEKNMDKIDVEIICRIPKDVSEINKRRIEQMWMDKLKPKYNLIRAYRTVEDQQEYMKLQNIKNKQIKSNWANVRGKIKVGCIKCKKEMSVRSINRHIKNIHK